MIKTHNSYNHNDQEYVVNNLISKFAPAQQLHLQNLLSYCKSNRNDIFVCKHLNHIRRTLIQDCGIDYQKVFYPEDEQLRDLLDNLYEFIYGFKMSFYRKSLSELLLTGLPEDKFSKDEIDILKLHLNSLVFVEDFWQEFEFLSKQYDELQLENLLNECISLEQDLMEKSAHFWYGLDLLEFLYKLNNYLLEIKEFSTQKQIQKQQFIDIIKLLEKVEDIKSESELNYDNLTEDQKTEIDNHDLSLVADYFANEESNYCLLLQEYNEKLSDSSLNKELSSKMFKSEIKIKQLYKIKHEVINLISENNSKNVRELCKSFNFPIQFSKIKELFASDLFDKKEIENLKDQFQILARSTSEQGIQMFNKEVLKQSEKRKQARDTIINGTNVNGRFPGFIRLTENEKTKFLLLKEKIENLPAKLENCDDIDQTYKDLVGKDGEISKIIPEILSFPSNLKDKLRCCINNIIKQIDDIYKEKKSKNMIADNQSEMIFEKMSQEFQKVLQDIVTDVEIDTPLQFSEKLYTEHQESKKSKENSLDNDLDNYFKALK